MENGREAENSPGGSTWTHRIVHYLRCYQTHLQDTNLRYSGQIGHCIDARKGTGMFLARASHCVRLNSAIPRRQNVRLDVSSRKVFI
jgi:hypothetical protein